MPILMDQILREVADPSWAKEGKAVKRACRALHLRWHNSIREPEPFAAVIYCTADRDKADDRTRTILDARGRSPDVPVR